MGNNAGFWDRMANHYSKQAIADEASYQKKLIWTQQLLSESSRVLEFGCGTGSTAIYHAPHVAEVMATDISGNMLAIGRDQAQQAKLDNIRFQQVDLLTLDSPDNHWDCILGLSVLHLVDDISLYIARSYELLKPGGVFISSTPCIADMQGIFKMIAPIFRYLPVLPSMNSFSNKELLAALQQTGFEIEKNWQPGNNKAHFIIARKPG